MFGIGGCEEVCSNGVPYFGRSDAESASTEWKVVWRNRKPYRNYKLSGDAASAQCCRGVVSDTRKFDRGLTSLLHDELHWLDVPERVTYKMGVMMYTAVFMVRHLGTLPTISPRPPTSLLGFVCVMQTVTSSLYLAVVSTHMAVGRFRSPVRRSGTRCPTSSDILRVVLTRRHDRTLASNHDQRNFIDRQLHKHSY